MKHHAYTNDPVKDPDYANAHNTSVLKVVKNVLDGSTLQFEKYLDIFESDKAFVNAFHQAIPIAMFYKFATISSSYYFSI